MKTSFTNPASWVPDDYGQYWRNCSTRRLIEQVAPQHPPVPRWLPKETRWQCLVHTQGLDGSIRRLDALKGSTDVRGNGRAWALLLALPPDRVWKVARLFTLRLRPEKRPDLQLGLPVVKQGSFVLKQLVERAALALVQKQIQKTERKSEDE